MKNLSKVLVVPLVYLPAIIMLIVSHSFSLDWQGLWIYYLTATGFVVVMFSGLLDGPEHIFCSNCGNKNKTNLSFCNKCGNKIN